MSKRVFPWSLKLITVQGIPIRIHLSFFILPLWIALSEMHPGGHPLNEVLFIIILFLCVLLHELGHSLMAKVFKIPTRDIVLYPFGGIATITEEATPKAELFIALAGPLVNVIIATSLYFILSINVSSDFNFSDSEALGARVLVSNIVLAVFNMIPAYPMDGGRVLRAVLSLAGVAKATVIASRISQVLSIGLGLLGFFSQNPFLIVIGAVIFSHAFREIVRTKASKLVSGQPLASVTIERSRLLDFSHATRVSTAAKEAVKSFQSVFPVVYGKEILGLLYRDELIRIASTEVEDQYVASIMDREINAIPLSASIEKALQVIEGQGDAPLVVKNSEGDFYGLVFKESILELLILESLDHDAVRSEEMMDDSHF